MTIIHVHPRACAYYICMCYIGCVPLPVIVANEGLGLSLSLKGKNLGADRGIWACFKMRNPHEISTIYNVVSY